MTDDATLLHRYVETRSEQDFAELVGRYLNLVYSAALRQVNGDTHLAEDVAQLVFTDLARKAPRLAGHRVLAGWLFTSTRFAAANLVRGARRRQAREQEAMIMQADSTAEAAPLDWERVRPILDDALAELNEPDREAILLRYLQGCDYAQVGAKLSLSENAARMRVDRAVEKLRALLARRGATSTATALAVALANQAVVAAPAGLAATVTGAAVVGAGAATSLTLMTMTKLQLGLAGAVLVAGSGIFAVQERHDAALRAELVRQPDATGEIARLQQENRQLAQTASRAADLRIGDAELARLRDEVTAEQERQRPKPAPAIPGNAAASAGQPPTISIKELDHRPRPSVLKQPTYPAEMAQAGIEGSVVVSFVIDRDGKVRDAHAVKSTRPEFEAAAVEAVSQWQFDPGRKGGRIVNTSVSQLLKFELAGKKPAPEPPPDWF